jgi:hypothetical protein
MPLEILEQVFYYTFRGRDDERDMMMVHEMGTSSGEAESPSRTLDL